MFEFSTEEKRRTIHDELLAILILGKSSSPKIFSLNFLGMYDHNCNEDTRVTPGAPRITPGMNTDKSVANLGEEKKI